MKIFIHEQIQPDSYSKEIERLKSGKPLPRIRKVSRFDPYLDSFRVLRVGGRLKQSLELYLEEKNLILVPNQQYIAKRLILHFHEIVLYLGRHITAGASGAAGYWITDCKRLVYYILSDCVTCRGLHGSLKQMADLMRNDQLLVHHLLTIL